MLRFLPAVLCLVVCAIAPAGDGDVPVSPAECDPWYPDKDFPKLTTPQWVSEADVEAVVVLAIDDMRDTAKYEQYLRPILNRLKQIDGRAPVSIMTCSVKPEDPQLQSWLGEGLSIEVHTIDHPCPLLQGGDFDKAKSTYDRCIDLLNQIPGNKPVAFRTPCCDSLNTVSPRFFSEIFPPTTPEGNFLQIDSSVMNFFTSDDESIPRELVLDENGDERFWKYKVRHLKRGDTVHENFVNYIKNYPYPYVINNTCWQFPCVAPSDWSAQHRHGVNNPVTVNDWKAALDITVHKQGVFNLVFHPHGWITAEQVVELIDHAVQKHGNKVKFLTFREAAARLNRSLCGGRDLRNTDEKLTAALSHADFRKERLPGSADDESLPQAIRDMAEQGNHPAVWPLTRPDGSHNGWFIRDRHLCWQNEDTALLPDLIHRVSFDELMAEHRRRETRKALPPVPVGAAVIDITPEYPVRLTGYGNRNTESEGVAVKIHARALVIGGQPAAQSSPHSPSDETPKPNVRSAAADSNRDRPPADAGKNGDVHGNGESKSELHHSESDGDFGGTTGQPLTVLITVDNCGVPSTVVEGVFEQVADAHGVERARFAISSTHTHSGPWLRDFAPNVLIDLPEAHAAHLKQYEADLIDKLVEVVDKAVEARIPGKLSVGRGMVGFAMNRRTLQNGQWTGFGETPDGPVDHQLPILAAHDADGRLIAVLANYACHATTETGSFNQISGDWPGFAADMIEADNLGAVALIAIGCGADANPSPRGTHEQARQHGRTFATEVQRLLAKRTKVAVTLRVTTPAQPTLLPAAASADVKQPSAKAEPGSERDSSSTSDRGPHHSASDGDFELQPIDPHIVCNMERIDLPLGPLPTREEWEQRAKQSNHAGHLAQKFLKMLDDGQSIPTTVPNYPVQTWCFGEDLAMVFLGGEVVVDYSIRLNDMFDSDRLWINAYSNDVPCYVASKRILQEGGYEADSSMVYYARPTRLAPEAEDVICDAVQKLLPHHFYSKELQAGFPAPKSPEESLACIATKPNLRIELVAAEPLIQDPVAFDWDVHGRLWVVEMGDYPNGNPKRQLVGDDLEEVSAGGRVRVLEDTDGDGRYDKATTFLDRLNFPTGICLWRNGVIITAAPDVLYAEDTDGDFTADIRRVLYTGFGEGNQQHRVNGLRWGLDGWLYLANGDSGGDVRAVEQLLNENAVGNVKTSDPVNVRGRDVRIQPDFGRIDTVSGQTQFGRQRDDFGNWFGNNNSNPIWHYILEERYLRRNPHATVATTKAEVSATPGAAPVYPTSRTLARFNDFDKTNRFTSACSTSIYRDVRLGKEFYGNAFTCEPVHNLVSRLVLERDEVTFNGHRADDERESEFFASSDNWTRPVMVRTGPDGAIYVADMYRQVIEHPTWIPAEYQRKMNLQAGSDRGRIYRIIPVPGPGRPGERGRGESDKLSESNRRVPGNDMASEVVSVPCCGLSDEDGSTNVAVTLRVTLPEPPKSVPTAAVRPANSTFQHNTDVGNVQEVSGSKSGLHQSESDGDFGLATRQMLLTAIGGVPRTPVVVNPASAPRHTLRSWFDKPWNEIPVQDLVERMTSSNGWWRDTAQRILMHRGEPVPTERLIETGRAHSSAAVRVQALHTLQAIAAAAKEPGHEYLLQALSDPHPEVRRNALRLLEPSLQQNDFELSPAMLTLVDDPSAAVRQQLALSLGASSHPDATTTLAALLRQNTDSSHIVTAVMTSLSPNSIGEILRLTMADPNAEKTVIGRLIGQAAAMKSSDVLRRPVLSMLQQLVVRSVDATDGWDAATQAIQSIQRHGSVDSVLKNDTAIDTQMNEVNRKAVTVAMNDDAATDVRIAALRFTAASGNLGMDAAKPLLGLLTPTSPIELQQAAVTAVSRSAGEASAELLDRWKSFTPMVRSTVFEQALQTSAGTDALLNAVAAGKLAASDIDASARERLLQHRDDRLRAKARQVLGIVENTARSKVVEEYQARVGDLSGNVDAGKVVFEKRCATCHRIQSIGKSIGADLVALKDRSTNAMLIAILDPNRAVETKFLSYVAATADGRTWNGMLLSETSNSVTLMGTDGKEHLLARNELDELVCSNRSLMPEGLEKDLSPQDLADVITFVQSSGLRWKAFDGNSPRLITVNADGTLILPAAAAQIYGPTMVFENKYGNLGWWSSIDDYAVWTIDVPTSGQWTVEIDYACENRTAGNALKLSTGTRLLTARVPGTGTWDDYKTWTAGRIDLGRGQRQLIVTAPEQPTSALIDLRTIKLIPPE